jgi:hypothetical protein
MRRHFQTVERMETYCKSQFLAGLSRIRIVSDSGFVALPRISWDVALLNLWKEVC